MFFTHLIHWHPETYYETHCYVSFIDPLVHIQCKLTTLPHPSYTWSQICSMMFWTQILETCEILSMPLYYHHILCKYISCSYLYVKFDKSLKYLLSTHINCPWNISLTSQNFSLHTFVIPFISSLQFGLSNSKLISNSRKWTLIYEEFYLFCPTRHQYGLHLNISIRIISTCHNPYHWLTLQLFYLDNSSDIISDMGHFVYYLSEYQ